MGAGGVDGAKGLKLGVAAGGAAVPLKAGGVDGAKGLKLEVAAGGAAV